jgi:hypothetical protein
VPTDAEVLAIAKNGEDQLHEFKAPGTVASKIAKEIAAMLNTLAGGTILYGVALSRLYREDHRPSAGSKFS